MPDEEKRMGDPYRRRQCDYPHETQTFERGRTEFGAAGETGEAGTRIRAPYFGLLSSWD